MSDQALQRMDNAPSTSRLTILPGVIRIRGRLFLDAVCNCGNRVRILKDNLPRTRSCGCLRSEVSARHCAELAIHGESGQNSTPEWRSWVSMRQRCGDPRNRRFKDYGGRGIAICQEWQSFPGFLRSMGRKPSPGHTLERKNNDGNYEPDNCVWALPIEQANNRRTNRLIAFKGKIRTVTQWANIVGLSPNALFKRLNGGWSISRSLTQELRKAKL